VHPQPLCLGHRRGDVCIASPSFCHRASLSLVTPPSFLLPASTQHNTATRGAPSASESKELGQNYRLAWEGSGVGGGRRCMASYCTLHFAAVVCGHHNIHHSHPATTSIVITVTPPHHHTATSDPTNIKSSFPPLLCLQEKMCMSPSCTRISHCRCGEWGGGKKGRRVAVNIPRQTIRRQFFSFGCCLSFPPASFCLCLGFRGGSGRGRKGGEGSVSYPLDPSYPFPHREG
jgi:hypothetical protein